MEAIGKKGTKKLRSLAQLGIARATGLAALVAAGNVATNALATAAGQIVSFDSPATFTSGGGKARSYLVVASITTGTASAVDLTSSVVLRMDGAPLVVAPQAPIGLGIGGHTDRDQSQVLLFWIVAFNAGGGPVTHTFGIQADIGGGNTHQIPAGGAEVFVTEIV